MKGWYPPPWKRLPTSRFVFPQADRSAGSTLDRPTTAIALDLRPSATTTRFRARKIYTKLAQLSIANADLDLWILAASAPVPAQLVQDARVWGARARIGGRLTTPVREIDVPEWTVAERDEILARHKISSDTLNAAVAQSLRNPRLLGIALTLFQARQIEDLNEFSAGRLLFEHIRASERDAPTPQPVDEFVAKLRTHASEMLARLKRGQAGDVRPSTGRWKRCRMVASSCRCQTIVRATRLPTTG